MVSRAASGWLELGVEKIVKLSVYIMPMHIETVPVVDARMMFGEWNVRHSVLEFVQDT